MLQQLPITGDVIDLDQNPVAALMACDRARTAMPAGVDFAVMLVLAKSVHLMPCDSMVEAKTLRDTLAKRFGLNNVPGPADTKQ